MAGFGENSRVHRWVIERLEGRADAMETPIGRVPTPDALDVTGLDLTADEQAAALTVDPEARAVMSRGSRRVSAVGWLAPI